MRRRDFVFSAAALGSAPALWAASPIKPGPKAALIVVDVQNCFVDGGEGRIFCSHEHDGDAACSTKLLWTRVHGGITRALAGTTLAELVEFEQRGNENEKLNVAAAGAA